MGKGKVFAGISTSRPVVHRSYEFQKWTKDETTFVWSLQPSLIEKVEQFWMISPNRFVVVAEGLFYIVDVEEG